MKVFGALALDEDGIGAYLQNRAGREADSLCKDFLGQ
jgi:hypothetical protein